MASERSHSDRRTLRWASLLVCILIALALEGSARPASGPRLSFSAAKYFATGADPQSFVLADVNGDGRPDVVTANSDGNSVSVLRNRGNGTFSSKRDYKVGTDPSPLLAAADLNRDKRLDLVFRGSQPHSLSVMLNRGDGTFGQVQLADTGRGCCDQLKAVDLNGDRRADVVARTDGFAIVLLNRGDGSFLPAREYKVTRGFPAALVVADLSGDGKRDISTTSESDRVSVLLNKGDGSFGREHTFKAPGRPLIADDLNRDGSPDLVTTDDPIDALGSVSVLINRGHGSFRPARTYKPGRDVGQSEVADLNGDGAPELIVISNVGVSVYKNSGAGRFRDKRNYPPHGWYNEFVVADVNGGGSPDLVFQSWDFGRVGVLLNRGNATFRRQLLEYYVAWGPIALAAVDLNGDRSRDVLTLTDDLGGNRVSVLLNKPGKCDVQDVFRRTLDAARARLTRGGCRLGRVTWGHSTVPPGHVMGQRPKFGAVLHGGSTVDVILSGGRS